MKCRQLSRVPRTSAAQCYAVSFFCAAHYDIESSFNCCQKLDLCMFLPSMASTTLFWKAAADMRDHVPMFSELSCGSEND